MQSGEAIYAESNYAYYAVRKATAGDGDAVWGGNAVAYAAHHCNHYSIAC